MVGFTLILWSFDEFLCCSVVLVNFCERIAPRYGHSLDVVMVRLEHMRSSLR
jgi:hypothetical protein